MTGTDKWKLLVIGKRAKPQCLRETGKYQDHSELFAHCGFKHSDLEMPNKANSKNDVILDMHHIGNYE
jgi:hypothetical protein